VAKGMNMLIGLSDVTVVKISVTILVVIQAVVTQFRLEVRQKTRPQQLVILVIMTVMMKQTLLTIELVMKGIIGQILLLLQI
jgi:hypothetical protein